MTTTESNDLEIPKDFPHSSHVGAVSGVQPKVLVMKTPDGKYVSMEPEDRRERYECCADMVEQLTAYCKKKEVQRPDLSLARVVDLTIKALVDKVRNLEWDFTDLEVKWIENRIRAQLLK